MKIIIDSNVFFSALIKDSITRKIILEYDDFFLFPEFIFEEMEKHIDLLIKKSKMKRKNFDLLIELLLTKVKIVPMSKLEKYKKRAYSIVKDIDRDDVIFIACSLAYEKSVVWSDDKKLKEQGEIKVINTKEMYNFLFQNKLKS